MSAARLIGEATEVGWALRVGVNRNSVIEFIRVLSKRDGCKSVLVSTFRVLPDHAAELRAILTHMPAPPHVEILSSDAVRSFGKWNDSEGRGLASVQRSLEGVVEWRLLGQHHSKWVVARYEDGSGVAVITTANLGKNLRTETHYVSTSVPLVDGLADAHARLWAGSSDGFAVVGKAPGKELGMKPKRLLDLLGGRG